MNQISVGGWIFKAQKSRRDLDVEKFWNQLVGRSIAEQRLFPTRVHDHCGFRLDQRFPEGAEIGASIRVDDGDFIFGCHLHKAKLRSIGILSNEFRIKSDKLLRSYLLTKLME